MEDRIELLSIDCSETALAAIKQMDKTRHRLLVVLKDGKYFSMVSIGDIQRAIIKGLNLNLPLQEILRTENITIAGEGDDINEIKALMK